MNRLLATWQKADPKAMAFDQSPVACMHAMADMKADLMIKIVIHRGNRERIINLDDVQVFRADCKNVVVRYDGEEWFVKYPSSPTLKALHALSDGSHIYASKSALISVSAIAGRISNYEIAGHYGAVMRDGQVAKVSRREAAAFNRVYRELVK